MEIPIKVEENKSDFDIVIPAITEESGFKAKIQMKHVTNSKPEAVR